MTPNKRFSSLREAFARKIGVDPSQVVLGWNVRALNDEETPEEVGMSPVVALYPSSISSATATTQSLFDAPVNQGYGHSDTSGTSAGAIGGVRATTGISARQDAPISTSAAKEMLQNGRLNLPPGLSERMGNGSVLVRQEPQVIPLPRGSSNVPVSFTTRETIEPTKCTPSEKQGELALGDKVSTSYHLEDDAERGATIVWTISKVLSDGILKLITRYKQSLKRKLCPGAEAFILEQMPDFDAALQRSTGKPLNTGCLAIRSCGLEGDVRSKDALVAIRVMEFNESNQLVRPKWCRVSVVTYFGTIDFESRGVSGGRRRQNDGNVDKLFAHLCSPMWNCRRGQSGVMIVCDCRKLCTVNFIRSRLSGCNQTQMVYPAMPSLSICSFALPEAPPILRCLPNLILTIDNITH